MHSTNDYVPALGSAWATKFYDPIVRLTTRETEFKQFMLEHAEIRPNSSVLDLGCGTGTLSVALKLAFPDSALFAIDADEEILAKAKLKASEANANVEFKRGFSDSLPYQTGFFDKVFSTLFFHHIRTESKIATLREISRVLKPNGVFLLGDYGKPANRTQKVASKIIRLVDGEETTRDNLNGSIPELILENGFVCSEVIKEFKTALGTIKIHRAQTAT